MILRKAMDGLMPDAVRWRTGKEHLGWDFTTALWQQAPGISAIPQIPEWIDAARMGTDRQDESGFADSLQLLHLSFWLDSQGRESTEHSPRAEIDREY